RAGISATNGAAPLRRHTHLVLHKARGTSASASTSGGPRMTQSQSIAVYPGTFDPITNGHLDVLTRALGIFDRVIVTIAPNIRKNPLFSTDEGRQFIRDALPEYADRLEYAVFEGLLVEFCRSRKASVIVRGLRALADFEYEFQFAHMNRRLAPGVDT